MNNARGRFNVLLAACATLVLSTAVFGQQVRLIQRAPDPHGAPRPARNARDVPLGTSIYFELGKPAKVKEDHVLAESVAVRLQAKGGAPLELLGPGRRFAQGASGWLRPKATDPASEPSGPVADGLAVYIEPGKPLMPAITYTVRVTARSQNGAELPAPAGTWTFTTEQAPAVHPISFALDLGSKPVRWHGAFFSGVCNVTFCTSASVFGPTYDLMAEARKQHPKAWSYQRDFWMTGTDDRPSSLLPRCLPNIVRERQTRRIAAMENRANGVLLCVEDFFGHAQYGIPAGWSVSEDYHPGDEVLVADGIHDARVKVLAVDGERGEVLVGPMAIPPDDWKIKYERPMPMHEDPDAPGFFPPGGCFLRKFKPHGTPCYYWGSLDKEWDLVHCRYGRRLMVNFADTPGELSLDGRNWTTAKDYAEWHEVVRAIAGHLIDRYGADALGFTWSMFNEPDLRGFFWRADWNDLQRFYDYTSDAILRAFEDRAYDSSRVFIGGLELGGIFGTHLALQEFLAHCSPRATAKGALPLNAAMADPRLDGKRSRRVESLCRQHAGKGSPCNFVSIHAYNGSEMMAAKLIKAKQIALEIDPEYYRDLWVNSHESCPDWAPPPDEAAADSYLGNGCFPCWCADVTSRQLRQAVADPRYAFGETIITVWPPLGNFAGLNAVTRRLRCDGASGAARAKRGRRSHGHHPDADLPRAGNALRPGRLLLGPAAAAGRRAHCQRVCIARRAGNRPRRALRLQSARHAVALRRGLQRHPGLRPLGLGRTRQRPGVSL